MKYSEFLAVSGMTHEQVRELSNHGPLDIGKERSDIVEGYLQMALTKAKIILDPPKETGRLMKQLKEKFPEHDEETNLNIVSARLMPTLFDDAGSVRLALRDAASAMDDGIDVDSLEGLYYAEVG